MALFELALKITLDPNHEGGYQKDPTDSGNWTGGKIGEGQLLGTKDGISAAEFPNLDIPNLTEEQIARIYLEKYWNIFYNQIEEQVLANKIFDMGVVFGQATSIEILQDLLGLKPDGSFGPVTLKAVNEADLVKLLQDYKERLVRHAALIGAVNPEKRKFVSSWIRRINS